MHRLAAFAGLDGVRFVFVRAEKIGLAPECDLRTPLLRAPAAVDARDTAGVAAQALFPVRLQNGDRRAVAELQILKDLAGLQTAAALCFPALQVCLPDNRLIPSVAAAAPEVLAILLSGVSDHQQL